MYSPFSREYYKAFCKQVETLEKMVAWDIVNSTTDVNVLELTGSFNLKRFPSGQINKIKAISYSWVQHQNEGVYQFETCVPEVQWTTIILMLVLELNAQTTCHGTT